mgnify:CR=1 FL=1|tara:strand:+ start:529 stop:732 length:204 start_codon:yes stop_codon:yes gene_type:complete
MHLEIGEGALEKTVFIGGFFLARYLLIPQTVRKNLAKQFSLASVYVDFVSGMGRSRKCSRGKKWRFH